MPAQRRLATIAGNQDNMSKTERTRWVRRRVR